MGFIRRAVLASCLLGIAWIPLARAAGGEQPQMPVDLKVGDRAPAFEAVDDAGQAWKSSDHVGKKVLVVYFYPAAMTRGCTRQACAYRDSRQKLVGVGAEVIGVSGDTPEGLAIFKKANNLNFTLLADRRGAIAAKFGVPAAAGGSFKMMVDGEEVTLRRDVSARRWTFVIGKDGKIVYKNTKVRAAQDTRQVLEAIVKLSEKQRKDS